MSSLKKFDYRIKDNRKRNIFISLIILVIITIIGVKLYQSKAEFKVETNNIDMVSGSVVIPATHYIKELEKTNKDQLVYDGTIDNNLRYIGATPNNYVDFNGEKWRIIGVMNNIDDGTGKKEARIKLIRDESIGGFSWDYKQPGVGSSTSDMGSNDWSDSQLMMMLNPVEVVQAGWNVTNKKYQIDKNGYVLDNNNYQIYRAIGSYYNRTTGYKPTITSTESFPLNEVDFSSNGLKDESKNFIDKIEWHLGGVSSVDVPVATAKIYYEKEQSNQVYATNLATWIGYVGLMYPSDYGFATSGGDVKTREECLTKELANWKINTEFEDCIQNNWLFLTGYWQTTMMPYASSSYEFADIQKTGYVHENADTNNANIIRPVLYLKSDVLITSGLGTKSDSYQLSF